METAISSDKHYVSSAVNFNIIGQIYSSKYENNIHCLQFQEIIKIQI